MPPVGAAIAAVASAIATAVATITWAQVGAWLLSQAISWGLSKLLAPKQNRAGDRQADTMTLSLGEQPREVVVGQIATAGQLVDCWNHDSGTGSASKNRAEVLVIKLSDIPVTSLEGMIVNDEYHAFTGDGDVAAFVLAGFGWGLRVYFRDGSAGQTPPSFIVSNSGGKWTSAKTMAGCAHVYVVYADNKDRTIWPSGRPRFSWVVKGAKLYDPRKDSTVAGGSGAHRIDDASTYEWSDNAYLIRYNWVRGFFNRAGATPQLMVGRGLTAEEAPPERAIARANVCDEAVSLKAGGTEKRYRAGGVIKSTDTGIEVEEWLAAAMGGSIVDRDGVVDIDPGQAQSEVFDITDDDLVVDQEITFSPYLTTDQMLNSVSARFIDPTQRYADVSTPVRRDLADLTADGGAFEESIDLPFVLSGTQAQRIAEIKRRQARLWRTFQVTVGPRFVGLESGDWGTFTSDRYTGGDAVTVVVTAVSLGADFKVSLVLREIAASVYDWVAATDELAPGSVVIDSTPAPAAITVGSFTATATTVATAAGTEPAIQCSWADFEDGAVSGIEFQVRKNGDTKITTTLVEDVTSLQALITAGVGAQGSFDIRARAVARVPGRATTWTSWTTAATGGSNFDNALNPDGNANLVHKSEFEDGAGGYGYSDPDSFTGKSKTVLTTGGKQVLKLSATSPGTNKTIALLQSVADAFPCIANEKLACRFEYEATGAVNYVYASLWFYSAADALVTVIAVALKSGTASLGAELKKADFVVPNNTTIAKAVVSLVANCNAGAMTLSLTRPQVNPRVSDIAAIPAYAPGPNADNAADVTGSNVASGITGQSPLATLTPPSYAGNAAAFAALGAGRLFTDTSDANNIGIAFDPGAVDTAIYAETPLFLPGANVSGTGWVQLNGVTTAALTGKFKGTALSAYLNPVTGDTMPTNGTMALNWRVKSGADILLSGTASIVQTPGDPPQLSAFAAGAINGVMLSSLAAQSLVIEVQRVSGPADLDIYGGCKAKYE